ncbi:acetate--CoA ligase [Aquilutibacter rugosus]|uniref:acetate--CoA ligase n=1 Tax=Aquilutibacter rugosus TaxID=3115820 RepID=UPI002F3E6F6E
MTQDVYPVPQELRDCTLCTDEQYIEQYARSIHDPDGYWGEIAGTFEWFKQPTKIKNTSFNKDDFGIKWFEDGELNITVNCLDRHLKQGRGNKIAYIFEPDSPRYPSGSVTFRELHDRTCQLANALRQLGIQKGDRVAIYMPMIVDAAVSMLACARIGAIHTVIFGGFSAQPIADRVQDAKVKLIITADEGHRGGKHVPLKANVDQALKLPGTNSVETVLVVRNTHAAVNMQMPRDRWFDEVTRNQPVDCEPERMNAEDPLFILYTSGSTGKPKGVLHTTGGYMAYAAHTHRLVFDLRDDDVFWCTADIGWITGHSYIVYGPLCNAATTVLFEGIPTYPDVCRTWQIVDRHRVTILYTAPTAIRSLMREGDDNVKLSERTSIRLLGSVGEPINPEAWRWYYEVAGDSRSPIVDTWWQTETGGIMISPLPGATALKPGSATRPFFGIKPELVDAEGKTLSGATEGNLVITDSWPGQMRTIYGDSQRFFDTYFTTYPGTYFTGDGARRDEDDYWWITGRVDDVINVSGHRIGTAEVESALVAHPHVAEAAVVGFPHELKGQGLYAYVTLNAEVAESDDLRTELVKLVRTTIGPIATLDVIHWAPGLPKTRSGKIMRRILRKIAEGELGALGDTSTLADPSVVDHLVSTRSAD